MAARRTVYEQRELAASTVGARRQGRVLCAKVVRIRYAHHILFRTKLYLGPSSKVVPTPNGIYGLYLSLGMTRMYDVRMHSTSAASTCTAHAQHMHSKYEYDTTLPTSTTLVRVYIYDDTKARARSMQKGLT